MSLSKASPTSCRIPIQTFALSLVSSHALLRRLPRVSHFSAMDPAAKKRRLDDLMGGKSASDGFGAGPCSAGPSSAPAAPSREAFTVSANEAVSFRLVRTAADMGSAPSFNPEFTHQVFREDETIFGYLGLEVRSYGVRPGRVQQQCCGAAVRRRCDLPASSAGPRAVRNPVLRSYVPQPADARRGAQIEIYLHAVTFHAYVKVEHGGTAPSSLGPPDNVLARLKDAFPAGFTTDENAFKAQLQQLQAASLPEGASELLRDAGSGARVLHLALTTPEARAWHTRLAPLVLFFIDGGTHLETECVRFALSSSAAQRTHALTSFAGRTVAGKCSSRCFPPATASARRWWPALRRCTASSPSLRARGCACRR